MERIFLFPRCAPAPFLFVLAEKFVGRWLLHFDALLPVPFESITSDWSEWFNARGQKLLYRNRMLNSSVCPDKSSNVRPVDKFIFPRHNTLKTIVVAFSLQPGCIFISWWVFIFQRSSGRHFRYRNSLHRPDRRLIDNTIYRSITCFAFPLKRSV